MKKLLAVFLVWPLAGATFAQEKVPPLRAETTYEIPYRLTDTKHIMVRVKINGKGPFNFIIDTGAPAMILTETLAKKVGGKEKDGWTRFESVELEGGLKLSDPRGVAIDMFQLKGMNAMGLAGVELHGVLGYSVLARYRIEYDFTDTKLRWTPSRFVVPDPKRIADKGGSQGGLEFMGDIMKILAMFSGIKPNFNIQPRGFLGAEFDASGKSLVVKSVFADGPADKAGLKPGDEIESAKGKSVANVDEILEAVKKLPEGTSLKLKVKRGDDTKELTVVLGKGL